MVKEEKKVKRMHLLTCLKKIGGGVSGVGVGGGVGGCTGVGDGNGGIN